MSQKLMSDLGENYEYIRTIANNTIELKKLEIAEDTAAILSVSLLSIILGFFGLIIFIILMTMLFFWFLSITASTIQSLGMLILILLGLSALTFALRKPMIYNPITKLFYTAISKRLNI